MGKLDDIKALGPPSIMRQYGRADAGFEKRNLDVVKKKVQTMVREAKAKIEPSTEEKEGTGTGVMVRLQPSLLARLDRQREGMTRPQMIRAVLNEYLDQELPRGTRRLVYRDEVDAG